LEEANPGTNKKKKLAKKLHPVKGGRGKIIILD